MRARSHCLVLVATTQSHEQGEGDEWACVDKVLEQRTQELRGGPRGLAKH